MGADTASSTEGSEPHPSRRRLELRERGSVKPLELFFDLVFVLGFTQCTALMSADPSWAGLGRGLQLELPGHAHLHLRGAAVCGSSR